MVLCVCLWVNFFSDLRLRRYIAMVLLYLRLRRYIAMVLCVCLWVMVSALAQIYSYGVVVSALAQIYCYGVVVSALAQVYCSICACANILLWCCVSVCGLTFLLTQLANQKLKRQSESESADTCTPKRTYFFISYFVLEILTFV